MGKKKKKVEIHDDHWEQIHPIDLDRTLQYLNNRFIDAQRKWTKKKPERAHLFSVADDRNPFQLETDCRGHWKIAFLGYDVVEYTDLNRHLDADEDGASPTTRESNADWVMKRAVSQACDLLRALSKIDF